MPFGELKGMVSSIGNLGIGGFLKSQNTLNENVLGDFKRKIDKSIPAVSALKQVQEDCANKGIQLGKAELGVMDAVANGVPYNQALAEAQKQVSLSAKAAAVGQQLFATALNVGVSLAITFIIKKIYEYRQSLVDAKNAAEDLQNTFDDTDEQIGKIKELKTQLADSNLTEKERTDIKQQLLDIQNQLIETYGEEANRLNLVNGEYETQLGIIRELNAEKASEWMTENYTAFTAAERNIKREREFTLTPAVAGDSELGKELSKLLDTTLSDLGFTKSGDLYEGASFRIKFTGTAEEAEEAIGKFRQEVSKLESEIGNKGYTGQIFNDILKSTSDAYNEAQKVVNEYQATYRQGLISKMFEDTDRYGNGKSPADLMMDYTEAVEKYNNALQTSESQEDILAAKNELEAVQALVNACIADNQDYAYVFDEIGDSINETAENYNKFQQMMANPPSELANALNTIKANELDAIDLQAMGTTLEQFTDAETSSVIAMYDAAIAKRKELYGESNYVGNVDIHNRPIVYNDDGSYSTTSTMFQEGWYGDEENGSYRIIHFTPILPDGTVLDDVTLNNYINGILQSADPMTADKEGYNIVYKVDTEINGQKITDGNLQEAFGVAEAWDQEMHEIQDGIYGTEASLKLHGEAWATLLKFAEEYHVPITEAIKLWEELGYIAKGVINEAEASEPWSYQKTLSQLDQMKEKFDVLDVTYAKLFDKDQNIGLEDLTSINEAFAEVDGIEDYVKSLQEAGQDAKKVDAVMDDLATAYINHTDILDNVTQENYRLIQASLEEMGIINAEEIVMARLSGQTEALAIQKQFLTQKGYELANATLTEANEFINEAECSAIAKQELAQLALEKIAVNENKINTSGDIDQIINLANTAMAGAEALSQLARAKSVLAAVESAGTRERAGISEKAYLDALKVVDQINNGTYNYQFKKIDKGNFNYSANYGGGAGTTSARKNGGSGGSGGGSGSGSDSTQEDTYKEEMDFFKERVEELQDAFELLEKNIDNVWGSAAKIKLINQQYAILEEQKKNTAGALEMYEAKAASALGKIPSDLRDRVVNGAINITEFIGKGNEDTVEAIKEYQKWADEIDSCKQSLAELKQQLRQLSLEKINAIVEEATDKFDRYAAAIDNIDKQIGLLEEAGEVIGRGYYDAQKTAAEKQLKVLEKEKEEASKMFKESVASGKLDVGSEEYLEAVQILEDLDGQIIECKTSIEEFDNAILELHWKNLERLENRFAGIASEIENLSELFEEDVASGDGTWLEDGLARLGLAGQQYELSRYNVGMYQDEIDKLTTDYLVGLYSDTEYADKLQELKDAQWDAVKNAEAAKDEMIAIHQERVEIMTEAIEEEIEAFEKATNARIEELDAEKELADYRDSLAEKQKSVIDIERQLAAMAGDNTATANAKRAQLEAQKAEAQKDLDKFNYDHSIDTQKEALNKELDEFTEYKNQEIEILQLTLEDELALYTATLDTAKANTDLISQAIANKAAEYGIQINTSVTTPWKNGENALAHYGEALTFQSSAFISTLMGVENEVWMLQTKADEASVAISNMFGNSADHLVSELNRSYSSVENLQNVTNALKDSMIATFDSNNYSLDSFVNKINEVTTAANAAGQAMRNMFAGGGGGGSPTPAEPPKGPDPNDGKTYHVTVTLKSKLGKVLTREFSNDNLSTATKMLNRYKEYSGSNPLVVGGVRYYYDSNRIQYYAKGARNISKDQLAWTQDPNGTTHTSEAIVRPDGSVLTFLPKGSSVINGNSTQNLWDMANNPKEFIMENIKKAMTGFNFNPGYSSAPSNNMSIEIGNVLNVEGSVSEYNLGAIQQVAQEVVNKTFEKINRQSRNMGYR